MGLDIDMNSNLVSVKKYIGSCCGNSFIILDCRGVNLNKQEKIDYSVKNIIKNGVDSALFIESAEGYDVAIEIFEKDGSESNSCGNGIVLVTYLLELNHGKIKTDGGVFVIEGSANRQALLTNASMAAVKKVASENRCLFVTIGEPHAICLVDDLNEFDLITAGERMQKDYPGGVNVDMLQRVDDRHYLIRTYERGVFGETKSCGTGSMSSFVAVSHFFGKENEKSIEFKSAGGSHWVSKVGDNLRLETLKKFCEIKNLDK